jgi:glycosyltransferase involved in cell wall biosynthesis
MGIVQDTVIVIPCFNEAGRLEREAFERALAAEARLRFLFVNDGSTDATEAILRELEARHPGRAHVLSLEKNRGKAEAVRRGVLHAMELGAALVGYWDADLATPLEAIGAFAARFDDAAILVVLGSRVRLLGRRIERNPLRHYVGRVIATAAAHELGLAVYDTQCGAKMFRVGPAARSVFEREFRLNWAFDVEVLARLRGLERRGLCDVGRGVVELPLEQWIERGGSKLGLSQVPRVLRELSLLPFTVRKEIAG